MKNLIFSTSMLSLVVLIASASANAQEVAARSEKGLIVDFTKPEFNVVWISPETDNLENKQITIKIGINSNVPIENINIYVNGLPVSNRGFKKVTESKEEYDEVFEQVVTLRDGSNDVKIEAVTEDAYVIKDGKTFVVASGAFADIVARRNFALLFANNDYEEWSDLVNPVNDAREIAQELQETYGFQVELVESTTKEDILLKIREYATRSYLPKDQLFIFFAGHGHFDEINGEGYLVMADSKSNDPTFDTYLSHNILRSRVDNIPSSHIFLTMDACFAGTLDPTISRSGSRGGDIYEEVGKLELIERKLRYKTRQFLTSGGKEYVPDGKPGMNSPFASKFLAALRSDGGPDQLLTIADIKGHVEVITPEPRLGSFGSDEAGSDFVFEKKKL